MAKYPGILSKKLKSGETCIMVRFKYLGKDYGVRNFTKLYNCKTQKSAFEKLQEVKQRIRENKDPFIIKGETLNDIFYDRINFKLESGEWRINTYKAYYHYYKSLIEKEIGYLKLQKIKYEHLDNILKGKVLSQSKGSYKRRLKLTLSPIFEDALKKGHIHSNPCQLLPKFSKDVAEKITTRVKDADFIFLAKEIYNSSMTYEERFKYRIEETQAYFTLCVMTAHRMGELIQLKRKDIDLENKKIKSPVEITKTREVYEFPLPDELIPYITKIEDKNALIFPNLKYKSQYKVFKQIVKNTNIKLEDEKNLTIHDIRRLMLNIMIRHLKIDSRIADLCLEHKENGVIKHYLDLDYEVKEEAFFKYWEILRGQND